ncbi:MAG: hypothetical protein M8354_06350 [Halalkalicoccus sp.]|nr:hypothetical protein [Halalkalicoccus sp.]
MRINTSDKYEWRTDLYDRVGDLLGENTRSGAVDGAAQFTEEMIGNLERVKDHPDLTPELAEELSTSQVTLNYRVETSVDVDD